MSGLTLKLAPNERVLINGAIIENGDQRAKISIRTPNTNILRLRDAIHPDEVCSPVTRLCYICQLILTGDVDREDSCRQIFIGMEQLSQVFRDKDSQAILARATEALVAGNCYQALKNLRMLMPRETRLIEIGSP